MSKPHRDNTGTYTVQNGSSQEDLERLLIHDQMFTSAMGGVLSEQPEPTRFQQFRAYLYPCYRWVDEGTCTSDESIWSLRYTDPCPYAGISCRYSSRTTLRSGLDASLSRR